jgi:hypothetical protein
MTTNLESQYSARAEARTRLALAAEALKRGVTFVENCAAAVKHLEAIHDGAQAEAAAVLANSLTAGGPDLHQPPPPTVSSMLTSSRADLDTAQRALKQLQSAHSTAVSELAAAERGVVAAVDQWLDAEREELAAQIERQHEQLTTLIDQLRASTPDALHTPNNVSIKLSPLVERALSRLAPQRDDTRVPVNVLQGNALRLVTANREPWAARRRRLIAGEVAEEAAA